MARKAERGGMPHLLIDRFRFDSFAPDSEQAGSNLLTRFGREVYMFFMITPPHETVERAWRRGLEVGRYKAVDDTLAHNVEAYAGMPDLFFTWALRSGMSVHYEFLDNSVPPGERPRTVAFGRGGELNVLDVKCLLDVERYRKINVDAASPAAVYPDRDAMAAEQNTRFLEACVQRLPAVNFAERATGLHLRTHGVGAARMDRSRGARARDRGPRDARRDPRRRARRAWPRRLDAFRRDAAGGRFPYFGPVGRDECDGRLVRRAGRSPCTAVAADGRRRTPRERSPASAPRSLRHAACWRTAAGRSTPSALRSSCSRTTRCSTPAPGAC